MKLPDLPFKLPDMPRKAAIGIAAIVGSLILFLVLLFTLGAARDSAVAESTSLANQLAQTKKNLQQSETDVAFVAENREKYEGLLQSDQLVPHTRLTAVRRMQELALQRGLTALNYDFSMAGDTTVTSAKSQPTSGEYRVNVETIKLSVGAPVDGKIYAFMHDLNDNFPGAAVVQSFSLTRASIITTAMLDMVSRNQDSGLVKGDIVVLWRTAQANEKKAEPGKK